MKTFKEIFNEAMGKTLASGLFMAQTQVPHRHSTEEPKNRNNHNLVLIQILMG
jgi:hypothetical protein